jgi:hypothetical protein
MKMTAENRVMQMHLPAEFVLPVTSMSILTVSLSNINFIVQEDIGKFKGRDKITLLFTVFVPYKHSKL